jgi:hypothetical protein
VRKREGEKEREYGNIKLEKANKVTKQRRIRRRRRDLKKE